MSERTGSAQSSTWWVESAPHFVVITMKTAAAKLWAWSL